MSRFKQLFSRLNSFADQANRSGILKLLEANSCARFIDLGCADGIFTLAAASAVGTKAIYGADLEVSGATREKGIEVAVLDVNQPLHTYPDDSFDVVVTNQVIEHLSNTDLFVKEIFRILRPGGYAIVSTPNLASWHNVVFLVLALQPPFCLASDEVYGLGNPIQSMYLKERRYTTHAHLRLFTLRALRDLFEFHGFKVERMVGGGYSIWPGFLAEILARIDPHHAVYATVKVRKLNAR